MVIKEGDIVFIDYVGYIADSNEVFDTTIEEEAKKAGIYKADYTYEPVIVAVGKGWVIKGLEESLVGKKEGDEYTVEIPAEKGYGERDPKKIKVFTEKRLRELGVKGRIAPGEVILVNNVPAVVRVVSGGRVLIDFNPPLAGKTLRYKVTVKKICKSLREKIKAIIQRRSKEILSNAKIKISEKMGIVEVSLGDYTLKNPTLSITKKDIAEDILSVIDKINKVKFIEEVAREEPQKQVQGAGQEDT